MGRTPDASLKGKKPSNKAKIVPKGSGPKANKKASLMRNPSHITNKLKRSEMYGKYLTQKRKLKDDNRRERKEKEAKALGTEEEIVKNTPRTLDNSREVEPTMVTMAEDQEVLKDELEDEFAAYFSGDVRPTVLITTRPRPSQNTFYFIADLQQLIPKLAFYPRKHFSVKEICQFAQNRGFTHVMILSEKNKVVNGLTISHVAAMNLERDSDTTSDNSDGDSKEEEEDEVSPTKNVGHFSSGVGGPTAFFKVSNVVTSQRIPHHGRSTAHVPELNLHGFGTRLGHRIGRLLGSLFPHHAEFEGRQVVTFHNQRDYLFVRHHRYIFDDQSDNTKRVEAVKANDKTNPLPHVNTRLQELGPRFTLKLRWIQEGIFDTQFGEYEWIHKRKEMDVTRRKFHL